MTDRAKPESASVETFPGRPTLDHLIIGAAVLVVAALGALLAGPGLGLLVFTLALLAGALWTAYGALPRSPDVTEAPPTPSHAATRRVAAERSKPVLPSISMPTIALDRSTLLSAGLLAPIGSILAICAAGAFLFLRDRNVNPPGFFADEAEIGLQSWRLLHGQASTTTIPFFYQHLEYNHLGTLSLFATAPFVRLFGLTEHAVRGASVFWMIAAAIVIYLTLRRLHVPFAMVPVIVTMMSPLVILVARTNFGHAASMFMMSLGFFLWVKGREQSRPRLTFLAGISIGMAAYGQPSYYIGVPVLLVAIGIIEIAYNRLDLVAYRSLVWLGLGAVLILLPVPYRALTYDPFLDRYRDKTAGAVHGMDRLTTALRHYPDYFSYDMLFVHGTTGWQTRHSIPGAPWFYSSMLLFLLVGLISLIVVRDDRSKRYFWPMALVLFLYPMPDIASRTTADGPYSYSLIWGSIGIPFVVGYGLVGVRHFASRVSIARPALLYGAAMLLSTVVSLSGFWRGPFANYPNVAADYWGWQFGAGPIAEYFKNHANEYDQFLMSGDFNGADVFPRFYFAGTPLADRVWTGEPGDMDLSKRQLIAVRADAIRGQMGGQYPSGSYLTVVDTIYYPNGQPAFYLMTVDPILLTTGTQESETPAG